MYMLGSKLAGFVYVHVGERDVFAKLGGGFNPYRSAVVVKVILEDIYSIILDSIVFLIECTAIWLSAKYYYKELMHLCEALLLLAKKMNCKVTHQ